MSKMKFNWLAMAALATVPSLGACATTPTIEKSGEARIADAVAGKVAGKAVSCLPLRQVRGSHVIDHTGILFEAAGTLYVNRPVSGADRLSSWNALVTTTTTARLCQGDVVRLVDLASNAQVGTVALGEFIPYRASQLGQVAPYIGFSQGARTLRNRL